MSKANYLLSTVININMNGAGGLLKAIVTDKRII